MPLIITGKDFKLTPSLKKFVTEKTNKLTKYSSKILTIKVELDIDRRHRQGDNFRAQIWVTLPGKIVRAGQKGEEMHEVMNQLMPKIEQQVKRYQDKQKDQLKKRLSIRK